jgi:hypothetical protein
VQWTALTAPGTATGTATITGSAAVTNSPVTITANTVAATRTASVSPNPLAFGNWATGTTSATQNLTVTNTGNSALPSAGNLTYTLSGSTTFTRVTTGTFPAGLPNCGNSLAVGASCTVKVQFAPTAVQAYTGSLTVSGTGVTVTPASVTLTGAGVATRATASIDPNPLTITLLSPDVSISGSLTTTAVVSLKNNAPIGGSQLLVTNVAVGPVSAQYAFTSGPLAGPDTCTGMAIAPQNSCTVSVRFTNLLAPRGPNRAGTITFTDSAATPTQSGALIGVATP